MATIDQADVQLKVEHLQNTVDQLSAKVDSYHISLVNIVDKKSKKKSDDVSTCVNSLSPLRPLALPPPPSLIVSLHLNNSSRCFY